MLEAACAAHLRPDFSYFELSMAHRIHPKFAWQIVEGEAVVLDPVAGTAMGLNRVGSLIWSLLETHSEEAIAQAVSSKFDVDEETARVDVTEFINTLRERDLLGE